MKKDPTVLLKHILECINLIEEYSKDLSKENFKGNIEVQDAIIRRLEIIGEAVRNLPQEFRQEHSEVDWQNPAGMRNVLIHGYFQIDLDVVWDTISNDLPSFKKQIKKILQ